MCGPALVTELADLYPDQVSCLRSILSGLLKASNCKEETDDAMLEHLAARIFSDWDSSHPPKDAPRGPALRTLAQTYFPVGTCVAEGYPTHERLEVFMVPDLKVHDVLRWDYLSTDGIEVAMADIDFKQGLEDIAAHRHAAILHWDKAETTRINDFNLSHAIFEAQQFIYYGGKVDLNFKKLDLLADRAVRWMKSVEALVNLLDKSDALVTPKSKLGM